MGATGRRRSVLGGLGAGLTSERGQPSLPYRSKHTMRTQRSDWAGKTNLACYGRERQLEVDGALVCLGIGYPAARRYEA